MDWIFELPRPVREAVLAAAGIGLAVVLFRFILRRAFVRLSNRNMATILERQFPQLNDSLLTSVSLLDRPIEPSGFNPQMLAHTSNLARQRLDDVPLSQVFNPMPLVRKVVIALGLALAVGLLAVMAPAVLSLWAERNLLLADKHVAAQDPPGGGGLYRRRGQGGRRREFRSPRAGLPRRYRNTRHSAKRSRSAIATKAAAATARPCRTSAGRRLPAAADEVLQEYSYPFTGVLSSIHLDIAGGDARLYDLQLKVVPNPDLNLKLVCEYPPYIERGPLTIDSVSGAVPVRVPIGSRVTIRGTADKPLEMARIDCPAVGGQRGLASAVSAATNWAPSGTSSRIRSNLFPPPRPRKPAPRAAAKGPGKRAPEARPAAKPPHEYTLQFTLRDTDGLKARDPIFLTLVAVPDEPPEVKVRLVGTREPVVTPKGRLPVTGTITDDQGWAGPGGTTPSRSGPRRQSRRNHPATLRRSPANPPRPPRSDRARCLWPSCLNIWQSMS